MADDIRTIVEQLRQLTLSLSAQLDQAEARIPDINTVVTQLGGLGLLTETVILGIVIYEGHYGIRGGPHDSGLVIQAGLMLPGGFGVICWDSEEYLAFRNSPPQSDAHLLLRFIPFEACVPAIRALLLPQVHPLLAMLLKRFRIPKREGN